MPQLTGYLHQTFSTQCQLWACHNRENLSWNERKFWSRYISTLHILSHCITTTNCIAPQRTASHTLYHIIWVRVVGSSDCSRVNSRWILLDLHSIFWTLKNDSKFYSQCIFPCFIHHIFCELTSAEIICWILETNGVFLFTPCLSLYSLWTMWVIMGQIVIFQATGNVTIWPMSSNVLRNNLFPDSSCFINARVDSWLDSAQIVLLL